MEKTPIKIYWGNMIFPLILSLVFFVGGPIGTAFVVRYIHKHYFMCDIVAITETNCYQQTGDSRYGQQVWTFMDQYYELADNKSGASYGCSVGSCYESCGHYPGKSYSCFYSGSGLYQVGLYPYSYYVFATIMSVLAIVIPIVMFLLARYLNKMMNVWNAKEKEIVSDQTNETNAIPDKTNNAVPEKTNNDDDDHINVNSEDGNETSDGSHESTE